MKTFNYLHIIPLFFININTAHSIQPTNYNIISPNAYESSINGFQNGMNIAEQAIKNKKEKALREREEMYRKDLKYFYDNPSEIKRENLAKLMLSYPEFNNQTQQIIDGLEKNGLLRD